MLLVELSSVCLKGEMERMAQIDIRDTEAVQQAIDLANSTSQLEVIVNVLHTRLNRNVETSVQMLNEAGRIQTETEDRRNICYGVLQEVGSLLNSCVSTQNRLQELADIVQKRVYALGSQIEELERQIRSSQRKIKDLQKKEGEIRDRMRVINERIAMETARRREAEQKRRESNG